MKVEIWDMVRRAHTITSRDPRIIGDWFAEKAAEIMSADSRMQECRIVVWPETHEECQLVGMASEQLSFTQDNLLYLAQKILEVSQKLADQEVPVAG